MNITFIHVFEIIIALLIVAKIFQIRKLYHQSVLNRGRIPINRRSTVNSNFSKGFHVGSARDKYSKESSLESSRHQLPLPEVEFSDDLPLPDVTYQSECNVLSRNEESKNKAVLNSYINDMFFESSFEFIEADKPIKQRKSENHKVDEFITISEENAKLVRDLEMFNRRVSFAR